jgi:membrane-associated phospholipid phosphatase
VALVPFYIVIAELIPGRILHAPELALDRWLPLMPGWALVYGSLYLFLIVLPVLIVRDEDLIHRTVRAYLMVWLVAFAVFLGWPTVAPRPPMVGGGGFLTASLRFLYGADPPYNCFPSLHVAHSFVSAMATLRVHRRLGLVATVAASLVGFSTLFTKQHYVLDVVTGVLLALVAAWIFLRGARPVSDLERRVAPTLAAALLTGIGVLVAGAWVVYRSRSG